MILRLSNTCVRMSNGEDEILWHSVYRSLIGERIGERIDGLVFAPRLDWRYYELRKAGMRGRPSAGNTECYVYDFHVRVKMKKARPESGDYDTQQANMVTFDVDRRDVSATRNWRYWITNHRPAPLVIQPVYYWKPCVELEVFDVVVKGDEADES